MKLIFCALVLFISVLVLSEIYIQYLYQRALSDIKPHDSPKTIVVLGARSDSPILTRRIRRAHLTSLKYPEAKVLLSGNESLREVSSMKTEFAKLGSKISFIEDTLSKTTYDNLKNSKSLSDGPYLIVTSDFHIRRAYAFAIALGLSLVTIECEPDPNPSLPVLIRERLANIKAAIQILRMKI